MEERNRYSAKWSGKYILPEIIRSRRGKGDVQGSPSAITASSDLADTSAKLSTFARLMHGIHNDSLFLIHHHVCTALSLYNYPKPNSINLLFLDCQREHTSGQSDERGPPSFPPTISQTGGWVQMLSGR